MVGIGAVLLQEHNEVKFLVAYGSKKLLSRETRYSVIERECIALVWGKKKIPDVFVWHRISGRDRPLPAHLHAEHETDKQQSDEVGGELTALSFQNSSHKRYSKHRSRLHKHG